MTIDHHLSEKESKLSPEDLEKFETSVSSDLITNAEFDELETVTAADQETIDQEAETDFLDVNTTRKLSNAQIVKNLFNGYYKEEQHKTTNLTSGISRAAAQASKPRTLNGKCYSTTQEVLHAATYLLKDETAIDKKNLKDDALNLYETLNIMGKHKNFYNKKVNRETKEYAKTHSTDEAMAYTQSRARKRDHLFSQYDAVEDLVKKRMAYLNAQLNGNSDRNLSGFLEDSEEVNPATNYASRNGKSNNGRVGSLTSINGTIAAVPEIVENPRSIERAKIPTSSVEENELYAAPETQSLKEKVGGWFNRGLSYFKRSA